MKKLALSILILAIAGIASAQPVAPITVTLSVQSVIDAVDIGRENRNLKICDKLGVVGTCNQANVCAASFSQTGQPASGSSCTANEADVLGIRTYAKTNVGLQNYIENELIKINIPSFEEELARRSLLKLAAECKAANQAGKDAVCTRNNLSVGCGICLAFQ